MNCVCAPWLCGLCHVVDAETYITRALTQASLDELDLKDEGSSSGGETSEDRGYTPTSY